MRKIILGAVLLLCQGVFSQHYDFGYSTEYKTIISGELDSTNLKIIEFVLSDNKKIKRIFNQKDKLLEELVFINDSLVSGVEYFRHPTFSFLDNPRTFQIQEVEKELANYQNIKFTASLIKYLPKLKKGIFKVRVYHSNNNTSFYILETSQGSKIYFL